MSKEKKFEEAFQRLEEIALLLESGTITLDESMQLYEEGMKLLKICHQKLNQAEKKILQLSQTAQGNFEIKPFDSTEDV